MIEFSLNKTEHDLLRNILNEVMQMEGTGGDEYEDTLNALHEKIVLYWMKESDERYFCSYLLIRFLKRCNDLPLLSS